MMKSEWSELFNFDEELVQKSTAAEQSDTMNTLNITPSDMSLLTVHSAPFLLSDHCSSIRSSSVSSSLSELASSSLDLSSSSHDTLNLEDIKIQLSQCCLTCGVCWKDEHFSFDCSECGGYSLLRPCQTCGGTCGALWSRDFAMSHAFQSAKWKGNCNYMLNHTENGNKSSESSKITFINPSASATMCGRIQFLSSDLRNRLEKLEIKS